MIHNRIRLSEREKFILQSLWCWRFLSTAALTSKRFFPDTGQVRGYHRLLELMHRGYIEREGRMPLEVCAWKLTKKGYMAIVNSLPPLRDTGFCSRECEHDFLLSAFHIGDWLIDIPGNVWRFSRQQIAHVKLDKFPSWVPKVDYQLQSASIQCQSHRVDSSDQGKTKGKENQP